MKNKRLAIRLEYKKNILHEVTSDALSETLSIGRAPDCSWIIPVEDNLASSHHAAVMLKNNRWCICDTGSRNGIFIKGERISERVLHIGDAITIGDCLLIVEEAHAAAETGSNRIQLLTGSEAGRIFHLEKRRYIIGSTPDCDIPLMNQLVSRKHAEIDVRADGCWLNDCGGKNGTSVNGTKLKTGTERLLKDSDIISIAQFDLKFLDRSVRHSQSKLWNSLLVASITAIAVFSVYFVYIHLNPSALDLLEQSRRAAAARNFEYAEKLLADSKTGRGAEDCSLRASDLARHIESWKETIRQWQIAQENLASGRWTDAAYALGAIDASRLEIWNWNDSDAMESRKQAELAKKLLDSFLTAGNAAANDETPFEKLKTLAANLDSMLSESIRLKLPCMENLNKQTAKLVGELKSDISANDRMEKILLRLVEKPTPYRNIITELEGIIKNSRGVTRVRAEKLVLPIIALKKSSQSLREAIDRIADMDFSTVASAQLQLPPLEQCALNPHIATLRREQSDIHSKIASAASRLNHLCSALREYSITEKGETPSQIACFFDPAVMKNVFACDVLGKKLPSRTRRTPAGDYDRILGMESFYDFLYSLPMDFDPAIYDDIAFTVEILRAKQTFRRLEDLSSFAAQDGNLIFFRGKLGGFKRFADELLQKRSALVKDFAGQSLETREGLIANGIAIFLAGKRDIPESLPEKYMNALKKYRLPLVKLSSDFSTASPARAIEIRDEILRRGIPGDPVVKKMWSKR